MIAVKKEADSMLPENKINPYLLPQIRKDFLEVLKSSKNAKDAGHKLLTHIGDK